MPCVLQFSPPTPWSRGPGPRCRRRLLHHSSFRRARTACSLVRAGADPFYPASASFGTPLGAFSPRVCSPMDPILSIRLAPSLYIVCANIHLRYDSISFKRIFSLFNQASCCICRSQSLSLRFNHGSSCLWPLLLLHSFLYQGFLMSPVQIFKKEENASSFFSLVPLCSRCCRLLSFLLYDFLNRKIFSSSRWF